VMRATLRTDGTAARAMSLVRVITSNLERTHSLLPIVDMELTKNPRVDRKPKNHLRRQLQKRPFVASEPYNPNVRKLVIKR